MSDTTRFGKIEARLDNIERQLWPAPTPTIPGVPPLNLTPWKLNVPVLVDGKIKEVRQPELATYSDKFYIPEPAGSRMRVWHGGPTTPGSPNPRTELRERTADGSADAKWSTTKGAHAMSVSLRVTRLTPVRPHLVIAQIHGAKDDVTVFRVEGSTLWITDGDEPHAYKVTDAFPLLTPVMLGFTVANGVITYGYNGQALPFSLKARDPGCYFKTGAYLQSNPETAPDESTSEYAEMTLLGVNVTHA